MVKSKTVFVSAAIAIAIVPQTITEFPEIKIKCKSLNRLVGRGTSLTVSLPNRLLAQCANGSGQTHLIRFSFGPFSFYLLAIKLLLR